MPIYEYHCVDCDDEFEVLVKTSAEGDHISCPVCESEQVTKKFSAFATVSATRSTLACDAPCDAPMERPCGQACGCHI